MKIFWSIIIIAAGVFIGIWAAVLLLILYAGKALQALAHTVAGEAVADLFKDDFEEEKANAIDATGVK